MKKHKQMSSAQRRLAGPWIAHYNKLDKLPQVGVIVFGAGLDAIQAITDAREQGYYIKSQTNQFATLHR